MFAFIGYLFHIIGLVFIDALVIAGSAVGLAIILGLSFSTWTDIKLKGSDPDQQGVAGTLVGGFFGALIGGVVALWLVFYYTAGVVAEDMLGFEVSAAVIAFIVLALYRRYSYSLSASSASASSTKPKGKYPRHW